MPDPAQVDLFQLRIGFPDPEGMVFQKLQTEYDVDQGLRQAEDNGYIGEDSGIEINFVKQGGPVYAGKQKCGAIEEHGPYRREGMNDIPAPEMKPGPGEGSNIEVKQGPEGVGQSVVEGRYPPEFEVGAG